MTVQDEDTVDAIGVDRASGACILTISDHLPWDAPEHLIGLQAKLNRYLAFIESGELLETYGDAKGRAVEIQIAMKHVPSGEALDFLVRAANLIAGAGFALMWHQLEAK